MNTYDVSAKYQGGYTKKRTSTDWLVVHHAAAHYKQQTGIEDVEAVRKWHMEQHHGWPGIGYHIALAEEKNGGDVACYILSDLDLQRAHVLGRNDRALGVACLTDFGSRIPDDKWINALSIVLRRLTARYPDAKIVGHKEITIPGGETKCPGDRWFEWKPRLLQLVAGPAGPDYAALWGTHFHYFAKSGIAAAWREMPMVLGAAVSDETSDARGHVWRLFASGAVEFDPKTGTTQVYVPRGKS